MKLFYLIFIMLILILFIYFWKFVNAIPYFINNTLLYHFTSIFPKNSHFFLPYYIVYDTGFIHAS